MKRNLPDICHAARQRINSNEHEPIPADAQLTIP